jgi:hypothetical protein
MSPTHYGRVEPFLEYRPGAGLDEFFPAKERGSMSLFIEVGLDLLGVLLRKQAGFRMSMRETQTIGARKDILDRHAQFIGKSFDSLTRHLNYFIQAPICYPAAFGSIPLSGAFRQG